MPVLQGPVAKKAFCGYRFFVIGADTKYPEASWEFMKFMMSSEQMWKRYKLLGIPVVRKSLMNEFINDSPEENQMIADYVLNGKGKYITPWSAIADQHFRTAYQEALNGVKPPSKALMDAQTAALEEIKKLELD
jgi:ABC-type glycerol-3-phosphate transport system substrate-binding protein